MSEKNIVKPLKLTKPDWIIHCVKDADEEGMYSEPTFANIHTHGLNKYDLPELCISIGDTKEVIERFARIINMLGLDAVNGFRKLEPGIQTDVLEPMKSGEQYRVEFISYDNDPTLYVILPDKDNKLPSDEDCDDYFALQYEYSKWISDNKEYI